MIHDHINAQEVINGQTLSTHLLFYIGMIGQICPQGFLPDRNTDPNFPHRATPFRETTLFLTFIVKNTVNCENYRLVNKNLL